jgi:hypothetical protein
MPPDHQLSSYAAVVKILSAFPDGLTAPEIDALKPPQHTTLGPRLTDMVRRGVIARVRTKPTTRSAFKADGRRNTPNNVAYRYQLADLNQLPETWLKPFVAMPRGVPKTPSGKPKHHQPPDPWPDQPPVESAVIPNLVEQPHLTTPSNPPATPPARTMVQPGDPRLVVNTGERTYSFSLVQAKALYEQLRLVFG